MTVYIEYVIIDNLVIDYILLMASLKTWGIKYSKIKVILSAVIGAIFAVFMPFFNIDSALLFIIKILLGEFMVFIAGSYKTITAFFKTFIIFLIYTFALGGGMIAVCFMLGADFSTKHGLSALSTITKLPIGLTILLSIIGVKVISFAISGAKYKKALENYEREISITDGKSTVKLRAIFDTGNTLKDEKTGKPVSIIDKKTADKLILNGVFTLRNSHYTPYSTIGGKGKILVFEIDRLLIYYGEDRNIIDNAIIGISPMAIKENTDVILNAGLITGGV